MLLDYWQSQVSNQLNKKSEKVLEYIKENYSNQKFVIDFYKKFTRLPSVKPTFMKRISDTEYQRIEIHATSLEEKIKESKE